MRYLQVLLSFFLVFGTALALANDVFDGTYLTIPSVRVGGGTTFTNVVITNGGIIYVGGVIATPTGVQIDDYYDPATHRLTIPSVTFNGITYTNVVITVGEVIRFGLSYPTSNAPTLVLNNPLPDATVGEAYSNPLMFQVFPDSTYTYTIDTLANGVTPTGMTVNLNGILSGTPFATGKADINGNQVANTYTFGVCATDTFSRVMTTPCPQTTITVNPANTLAGTWSGNWSWSGPGSNGCSFSDGGAFSMTLTQSGSSFSGSNSADGVQYRDNATCALISTNSSTGSASGTLSGTAVTLSFDLSGTQLSFSGTGTLNGKTLTASFTRVTGGNGSFTLTRQ